MPESVNVLVDTSAWLDVFTGVEPVLSILAPLMHQRRVVVCGMVRQEVVQGSRDEARLSRMERDISLWSYEAETPDDFAEAARTYARLRWKGVTVPAADCLIAEVAKRCGYRVFATDPHFSQIPGVRLFEL